MEDDGTTTIKERKKRGILDISFQKNKARNYGGDNETGNTGMVYIKNSSFRMSSHLKMDKKRVERLG